MKILRAIIKLIGWLLILLSGLLIPIILYQLHAVIWGDALEGEVIYLDAFAPSKIRAITQFVVVIAIFVLGLSLEHYGTKAMDKVIKNKLGSENNMRFGQSVNNVTGHPQTVSN